MKFKPDDVVAYVKNAMISLDCIVGDKQDRAHTWLRAWRAPGEEWLTGRSGCLLTEMLKPHPEADRVWSEWIAHLLTKGEGRTL